MSQIRKKTILKFLIVLWVWTIAYIAVKEALDEGKDESNSVDGNSEKEHRIPTKTTKENSHPRKGIGADNPSEWKKIVVWTDYFIKREVWPDMFVRLTSRECEEYRCNVSLDLNEASSADAVLFNGYNLRNQEPLNGLLKLHIKDLPSFRRNPDQLYIFYSMEPPPRLDHLHLTNLKSYFNWTMSYRTDADVLEPFGKVTRLKIPKSISETAFVTDNVLESKKSAVWLVSHCPTEQILQRNEFVSELRKYIPVDIIGMCGKKCDSNGGIKIIGKPFELGPCEREAQGYAFFLSLENSLCKDYITEKAFKALKLGIVPVVFGAGNYSSVLPKNSFIDYRDFQTISDLANHMKRVASSAALYNKYLAWQTDYEVDIGNPHKPLICNLCQRLHNRSPNDPPKSYPDIKKWFIDEANCVN